MNSTRLLQACLLRIRLLFQAVSAPFGLGRAPRHSGQTLVEYALLLSFVTVLAVATFSLLDNGVFVVFNKIITLLDSVQAAS